MTSIIPISAPAPARDAFTATDATPREQEMMKQARAFEAVFVAQMLSQSGLADAIGGETGFAGEAFSGMMVENYAEQLVEQGGFGLAKVIYAQLQEKDAANAARTDA